MIKGKDITSDKIAWKKKTSDKITITYIFKKKKKVRLKVACRS